LCEGGKPYQIEKDCYAVFSARKPDGTLIENYCIIAGNVIEYTFTEQTTAVSGMLDCEIKLYGGESGLITSPRFTVIVDTRVVSDAEVESTSEYNSLTSLYTDTLKLKTDMEALQTDMETKRDSGYFDGEDVNYNLVSNALKGSASGNPVRIDDVSPVEHAEKVKVHGKNLFDVSKIPTTSASANQSYISDVGSNYIVVKTPEGYTGNGFCTIEKPLREICPQLTAGKIYMLNADSNSGLKRFYFSGTSHSWEFGKTMTVTAELLNSPVTFYGLSQVAGNGVGDCKISNIQIEEGVVATEYVPYIDPTTVTLTRYGESETDNPKTYKPNPDGSVDGVTSLYPTTTLMTDTESVVIDVEYNKDANKVIDELLGLIIGKTFITDVEIYANKWVGTSSPYSQVVTVAGATKRSQVDLTPSAEQLAIFHNKDLAFVTENYNGVITVYAIGQKPTNDYTIQATVTEVNV
jgi:hypothetical protein